MKEVNRNTLRKLILVVRDQLTQKDRLTKSSIATRNLLGLDTIQRAGVIFVYMHFQSEVQTLEFIYNCLRSDKVVAVPVTFPETSQLKAVQILDPERDVEPGYCLIPEPKSDIVQNRTLNPSLIDVVVVPGSVFDRGGGRLGYGGGYYDRFLTESAPGALRIGLAYELQMIREVPTEPHDQFMDYIVTEKTIYNCRGIQRAKNSRLP